MKVFQTVRRQYAALGIRPNIQLNQRDSSRKRVLFGFLLIGCLLTSQSLYTFLVADGFMELVESVCSTSGTIIVFICFAAIVFKKNLLFANIDNIEQLIDGSE